MKIKFNIGQYNPRVRIIALATAMAMLFALIAVRLVYFQIVRGDELLETAHKNNSTTITVTAARGDIVDRYGRKLATSESAYNVIFNYAYTDRDHLNASIYNLIVLFRKNGVSWEQDAPITRSDDGSYSFAETGDDSDSAIETMTGVLGLNVYATAENCVEKMLKDYGINYPIQRDGDSYKFADDADEDTINELIEDLGLKKGASAAACVSAMDENDNYAFYSDEDAFAIALVRYGMESKQFSMVNEYTFAKDVSTDLVVQVSELSSTFPGVEISQTQQRVYVNNTIASSVIGNIGPMYAEDYATLKDDENYDYAMNDYIGKFGIEKTYEDQLRGQKGTKRITTNSDGEVVEEETVVEAQTGNTVRLTIDSYFQSLVSSLLASHIQSLPTSSAGYKPMAGSVVVMDTTTGEVLAAVNYPSYDLNTYNEDYNELADSTLHPDKPLTDRWVTPYRPGSTFKTIVATAGLETGLINRNSTITCTRVYNYYLQQGSTFAPTCLSYHGSINVVTALKVSCNIFFYELGRRMGIDTMNEYAALFGIGQDTGLEIYNQDGRYSDPERIEANGGTWYEGNVVQAAIGQMDTAITPLQLCIQASVIANRGTRYASHIVKDVETYNGEIVSETASVVQSSFEMQDSTYTAVRDGMLAAASSVTGLTGRGYNVCIKTGTPQVDSGGLRTNNCAIAFTEGGPNLAIAVMLEDGTYANRLIGQVLDAYDQAQAQIAAEQAAAQTTETAEATTEAAG